MVTNVTLNGWMTDLERWKQSRTVATLVKLLL